MSERIYLDFNATTPLLPEVREAMVRLLADGWGNPSSHHWSGRIAKGLVDQGRSELAVALRVPVGEIVFCSGASEADNLAIHGLCAGRPGPDGRDTIVITAVEHPAVRAIAEARARDGWQVETVRVERTGALDPADLAAKIGPRTKLVSVMAVNNETGVVFPVAKIGALAHAAGALFHCDAVQALGKIPVDLPAWGADLATITSHKCGGPKGVGALRVAKGLRLTPLIVGGSQEKERRAGTENVLGIAGFGLAAKLASERQADLAARLAPMRDRLERELLARVPGAVAHGAATERVANTTYLTFPGVLGENLLIALDLEGVAVSGGSACASGALHPSHTLEAMGVPANEALGAVRFSLGPTTTDAEIDRVIALVPSLLARQRQEARA